MIMAKFKVFSQVIKKGLSGAEDAIMGKYLIITEMAHIQKKPTLAVRQGCSYNYCQSSSDSFDDHVQFSIVKSYKLN